MSVDTQEQEVSTIKNEKERAINDRMRSFIIGELGMPANCSEVVSLSRGGAREVAHVYQSGKNTFASLGRHAVAAMDVDFILSKYHRVSMTTGLGSFFNRILADIEANFYTPNGLHFESSKHAENVEYLNNACQLFEQFYHVNLRMGATQPFAYAEFKRNGAKMIDIKFTMGHGIREELVNVMTFTLNEFEILASINYNISESVIANVSKSIMSMVHHLDGDPFAGKEYRKVNYPSVDLSPANVALMQLRAGIKLESPVAMYVAYCDIVVRARMAGVFDKFDIEQPTPYGDLSEMQKGYLMTLHTLVITMFNSLTKNRSFTKSQA